MARGIGSYIKVGDEKKVKSHGKCAYCNGISGISEYAIDHIHPIYWGGKSELKNLTLACKRCNSFKGCFLVGELLERMISKRETVYNATHGYLNRLEMHRRRRSGGDDLILWLENKIKLTRKEHTYFTAIINTLKTKSYLING